MDHRHFLIIILFYITLCRVRGNPCLFYYYDSSEESNEKVSPSSKPQQSGPNHTIINVNLNINNTCCPSGVTPINPASGIVNVTSPVKDKPTTEALTETIPTAKPGT